jgi:YD repeat-containing protein
MKNKRNYSVKSLKIKQFLLITLTIFISSFAYAQIPNVIPYQGQITDTSGKGYNGNFDFTFKILDNNSSTLWSSNTLNLEVFKGAYSVNLGQSPQPALPSNLVSNDIMFLEISFNDGTNGMETLSPNVQVLPVPYALRAAVADSATNSNGQLAWGDSLVLRDASGDVRFVINPNTGEFKAMQKDTTWYKVEVNSPPKITKKNGDGGLTEEAVVMNGKRYTKNTLEINGMRIEKFVQHDRDFGNEDTIEFTKVYDGNCLREMIVKVYKVSTGRTREKTYTYDCPSGKPKGIKDRAIDGDDQEGTVEENKETFTKTTKKTSEGSLHAATVDTRTGNLVAATFSPKDSCYIINADKFILQNDSAEYIIRLNDDGTISTEAKKFSLPFPPVMELMDPLQQFIQFEGMKEVRYEYLSDELVRFYRQKGVPDEILEIMNISAATHVYDGINNLQRLVDSVMVYKVTSKSVKDSIVVLYNAVGHFIEMNNVEEYRQLSKDIAYIRLLRLNVASEIFRDEASGVEIQRQIDLLTKNVALVGANGNDVIMGGDEYDETYVSSTGTKEIKRTYKPDSSAIITSGVIDDINRVFVNDTFNQVIEEVDVNNKVKNRVEVKIVPSDSLFEYDGATNVVRHTEAKGNKEVHVYDALSRSITETNNPKDSIRTLEGLSEVKYDGLTKVVRSNSSGVFMEQFEYDANQNVVFERTSAKDSSKLFVDLRKIEFQGTRDVVFEFSGSSNSTFVAHDPDNKLVIHGGIKTAEWDFDSAIAGLYNDGTRTGLNFTNPRTNNALGLGFDPDGRAVFLQGNGKATFVTDTVMAADQLRGGSLEVGGNALVAGNLNVIGNVSKGGGTFKIDHPQDPYNKYLYHSFIESPDMMNVYNGNTVTDSLGYDTIDLPNYFGSLNKDFRYQLTCIGTFAQAIVLEEIENNQFVIQTNKPKVKVSWQVTGVRRDHYANQNRVQVEVEKADNEKGTLLYPPKLEN